MNRIYISLIFALTLFTYPRAHAQTSWAVGTSGDWSMAGNWSAGVPDIAAAVLITNAGSKTVTVDPVTPVLNRAARRMDLYAPTGSTNTLSLVNLGASPFMMSNSFTLNPGSRLQLTNSIILLDGGAGGAFNQFAGDIIVAGGGLVTTNGASLRIGRSGLGQVTMTAGELMSYADFVIGGLPGGTGQLTISGGMARTEGTLYLGDDPGAVGAVFLTGGTLIATNPVNTSRIGDDGTGTLTIQAGTAWFDSVSVGRGSGAVGRLNVRGGSLNSRSLSFGRFLGSTGTLEVSGGQVDMLDSTLYVGREGTGTALLSNGVVNAQAVLVSATPTATGSLQLHGGTLNTLTFTATNAAGTIQFNAGQLNITQSTLVSNGAPFVVGDGVRAAFLQLDGATNIFADGLVIAANATLRGAGNVTGTITVLPGGSNQLGAAPPVVLNATRSGAQLVLQFASVLGQTYDIQSATNVTGAVWQTEATLPGTGGTLAHTNAMTGTRRFYRLFIH